MSLPKRPEGFRPGGIPLTLAELFGRMRIVAFNSSSDPTELLVENDGTLRSQSILYHSGTTQIRQKAETDGTALASLYGKASGTLTALGVEATTGELRTMLTGKDEASNIDALRTDPNRILWVRSRRHLFRIEPILVPSSDGILLDGSTQFNATDTVEVTFEVINVDGSASVDVDIWVDIQAGGTPAGANEYLMKDVTIPAGGSSGERRVVISGDDDIRGVAGAANDAAVNFIRVERVDVNA